jgi:TonB-linked SusC/RagA family outer membrane protein
MTVEVSGMHRCMASGINILLLVIALFIFSSSAAQDRSSLIYFSKGQVSVDTGIKRIERIYGIYINWSAGVLDPGKKKYWKGGTMTLEEVLHFFLDANKLTWKFTDNNTLYVEFKPAALKPTIVAPATKPVTMRIRVKDTCGVGLSQANLKAGSSGRNMETDRQGEAIICTSVGDTIYSTYAGMQPEFFVVRKSDMLTYTFIMRATRPLKAIFISDKPASKEEDQPDKGPSIPREQMAKQPVSSIQGIMAARIAGLLVTQVNGVYGANFDITLRGRMSILNGHDPFYIIDRVPFAPGPRSVSNIATGNAAGGLNPLSFIQRDDIESIQVLKDADATAMYGSRGANGVIIITTRRASLGRPKFSMNLERGYSAVTRLPQLMDIHAYTKMRREALSNDGLAPNATNAPDLLKWDTSRNTDWQKYFVRGLGSITRAHGDVSGGNAAYNGFLGASWVREANVFINHPVHDLFTVTARGGHTSANERLGVDIAALAGWDKNAQYTSDVSRLQFLVPNAPSLWANGRPVFNANGVAFSNPLSFIGDTYQAHSHNYLLNGNVHYRIWDSLFMKLNTGFNEVRTQESSIHPAWNQDTTYGSVRSSSFADERWRSWVLEPSIEYRLKKGRWHVNWATGASLQGLRSNVNNLSAYGFSSDLILANPGLADSVYSEGRGKDYLYTALWSQLTVQWKGNRSLNLIGRRDGSSRFGNGTEYGNFGGIGAHWTFSQEPFFHKLLPVFSYGKLKASYGVSGNDAIGGGQGYLENWSPTASLSFQQPSNAYSATGIVPDVSWEKVKKVDLTMDWGFLDDRVLFTATWYLHRSDHQLLPDNLPMAGQIIRLYNKPVVLQNKGWEFSVTSTNIRDRKFSWNTTFNVSFPVSKLISFPGLDNSPFSELVVGQSLSALRAYKYLGINPEKGIFQFEDRNRDNAITKDDQTLVGKLDVTSFGGMENTFSWGNWDFSALLEARMQTGASYQAAIYAANRPGSIASGLYSNQTMDMVHRWTKPGDTGPYQLLTTKATSEAGKAIARYLSSSGILTDASYLRLKTLSLSYRHPRLFKMGCGRIYLQTENLLTLTPYKGADPENQSILALPPLKTVVVGMELKF